MWAKKHQYGAMICLKFKNKKQKMKNILYITTRVLSVVLAIPALIVGIPSLCMMMISDTLDPDPYNLNK